jgi:type IV pilus assembly protein PilV
VILLAIKQFEKGAGFIEVLIALVVLAIGLLGVLSMQARGLGSNQRAVFASEINFLSSDMTDRILSFGTAGADAGQFDGIDSDVVFAGPDVVVNRHALDWSALVTGSSLPSSVGGVAWDVDTNAYTITLQWDDERTGTTEQDCGNTDRDDDGNLEYLTCFQFTVNL